MSRRKVPLGLQIFLAMAIGALIGAFCTGAGASAFVTAYIQPFGTIFINLLRFIVVPVVLLSILDGIVALHDLRRVGSIGWKTLVYYFCTTAVAIAIGLAVAQLARGAFPLLDVSDASFTPAQTSVMDTLVNLFPSNAVAPLLDASMLQIIVIALLFGAGVLKAGAKGAAIGAWIQSANSVTLEVMQFLIRLSPIGVLCLMLHTVAVNGPAVLGSLGAVLLVTYLAYLLHLTLVYSISVRTLGGLSPRLFFRQLLPAILFAFTSTSSVATLPLTHECCESLGADEEVNAFVLPLGATINMDGTAIYMGVTSVFIASCFGVTLTMAQLVSIILTATLASIGTAGVSGAGPVMLAMVLESVGLPVAGVGLIFGVDKLFDMGRTALNVVGDASCAVAVSRLQRRADQKKRA